MSHIYVFYFSGVTKVVASKYVKKHHIDQGENRGAITIASFCLSSVEYGPCFYLLKAENINQHTFQGNFSTKHGAPPGSNFIPTLNAYMTDKVWNDMAPAFAKILWDVPVVKKYPDLWMAITLDYSGYYLEGDALDVFADHNILIVKGK